MPTPTATSISTSSREHHGSAEAGQLEAGLRLRDVARVPGALRVELPPTDWSEEDQRLLERVLGEALEALTRS